MRKPLLIIDGDSFAHRAYHALPKTIRRDGNKPAGAILKCDAVAGEVGPIGIHIPVDDRQKPEAITRSIPASTSSAPR